MSYGFIITRHVNSETTNKYWNQNIKLIRTFYPLKQIIIIDDNSNYEYVKRDCEYKNVQIIQSEYHGRGELLPFIYFLKHKWFDNAIIIHDSTFIHKRIPFEQFKLPVLPLWHHTYDKEYLPNLIRISKYLKNKSFLEKTLNGGDNYLIGMNQEKFNLCFGVQCYINLKFLEGLQNKYNITNLVHAVHCRKDRCGLERIFGLLFCLEFSKLLVINSLFGSIFKQKNAFNYNYDTYINDFNKNNIPHAFVKVWTGR
jgi:hypothetical protein